MRAVVLTTDQEYGEYLKLLLISAGIRRCESYHTAADTAKAVARLNAGLVLVEWSLFGECRALLGGSARLRIQYAAFGGDKSVPKDMGIEILEMPIEKATVDALLSRLNIR